jgi:hypothetical protein
MPDNIEPIARHFQIDGKFLSAKPYGSGHLNDTYLITFDCNGTVSRYIFQKINKNAFKNIPALMENIVRVTEHIRRKLEAENAGDISRRVLTVISTRDQSSYYQDIHQHYWRAYIFITNAQTYDVLESTNQACEAARMFGLFQKMLVDLPQPPLHETIANFHNGPSRLKAFQQALEADVCNRAKNAKSEIDFLTKHTTIFDVLPKLVEKNRIPVRTTHNDTKINNVMLDNQTNEGLCVIDLDTVMPGLSVYDFGDLVRTATNSTNEDERDLSKVFMDITRFKAVLRGYLSTAGDFLNDTERSQLVFGGKMITLIMGTRFLTDYLVGDTYYKIHRQQHNLDRCRTQFKLLTSIIKQEDEMNALVNCHPERSEGSHSSK